MLYIFNLKLTCRLLESNSLISFTLRPLLLSVIRNIQIFRYLSCDLCTFTPLCKSLDLGSLLIQMLHEYFQPPDIVTHLLLFDFSSSPLFSLSLFLPLIPSDIPSPLADAVSPVFYSLFLFLFFRLQHDLMCLSSNKREEKGRRKAKGGGRAWGRGGWRGWEAGLRPRISDSPALSLLSSLHAGEKHPAFFIIIKPW